MLRAFILVALLPALGQAQGIFAPAKPRVVDPLSLVGLAVGDLLRLPPEARQSARYLTLENIPLDLREEAYLVLCGHLQHLSRESDIVRPRIIPGSGGALLRLHTDDYGWSRSVWESLATESPYTHVRLEIVEEVISHVVRPWPGGVWPKDGKVYAAGSFTYYAEVRTPVRTVKENALAPWLAYGKKGKANLAALVEMTQSKVPLVRGDWFFNQTAIQFGRKPGYYDFLGVKDEAGFRSLVGFDKKLAQTFGKELREAVGESEVTLEPRALARENTLGGAYWRSFDFIKATDRKNPLRILGKDIEAEYDASEQFGHLPNGFWATGVFKRGGERQDFAPGEIASDGHSVSNDRRVHVNISCIRCHGAGGLRSIDSWFRNLLRAPIGLTSPDPLRARELRQQYGRKIEEFQARDKAVFEAAVKEATGWDSAAYTKKYAAFWERYEDAKIDLQWMADDLGIDAAELRGILSAKLKASAAEPLDRRIDLVIANFIGQNPKRIGIRQYEEIYHVLKEYLSAKEQAP